MLYIRKLFNSIKSIILITIIEYLIIIISSIIYTLLISNDLNIFTTKYLPIIMIPLYIILIIILLKKYKYKQDKLNKNLYFPLIYLGISISCSFNMLIYLFNKPTTNNISIYISILSTGLIGPVLEEILFRYILLNKLKEFNSPKISIIISTIIFSIFHISIIKIIYTIILGLILNIIYHKTNNLKSSILIHISANIISLFLYNFNIYILLLSIPGLIISTKLIHNVK